MLATTRTILERAGDSMLAMPPEPCANAQRRSIFAMHVGCAYEAHDWNRVEYSIESTTRLMNGVMHELTTLGFVW